MARVGIDLRGHVQPRGAIDVQQTLQLGADEIARAAEDVDWQRLGDTGGELRRGETPKRADEIGGELVGQRKAAQGVGDIFVHFICVAREPVIGRAGGEERLVLLAKQQRLHERAFAARPKAPALERDDPFADGQNRRRRA